MKDKVEFSVVIPLYNKAHTLEETLTSVLAQTHKEFEVVIIDDGSTDNGPAIIKNLTNDSRVRVISQENMGVSAARNKGVQESKFEHIAFLDGDDIWLPEYLNKIQEAVNSYPSAGMYCCAGYVKHGNGTQSIRLAEKYKNKICQIDFFENPHVFLHTSATIVLKKDFQKIGGFPIGMKRNQDFALFFSLALITPVVYCGFTLSIYNGGVEGQATNIPSKVVLSHVVNRFNHVHQNWINTGSKNDSYKIFSKYELRHTVLNMLRSRDYSSIAYLFKNLDSGLIQLLHKYEVKLYQTKNKKHLSIFYIMHTKIRWRLRGHPLVK